MCDDNWAAMANDAHAHMVEGLRLDRLNDAIREAEAKAEDCLGHPIARLAHEVEALTMRKARLLVFDVPLDDPPDRWAASSAPWT